MIINHSLQFEMTNVTWKHLKEGKHQLLREIFLNLSVTYVCHNTQFFQSCFLLSQAYWWDTLWHIQSCCAPMFYHYLMVLAHLPIFWCQASPCGIHSAQMTLGQAFPYALQFSASVSSHQCFILIFHSSTTNPIQSKQLTALFNNK